MKKKTKDKLVEKYEGNVIVDTKHELDLKDRANGDKYVLTFNVDLKLIKLAKMAGVMHEADHTYSIRSTW